MITNENSIEGLFTMESGGGREITDTEFHTLFFGDFAGEGSRKSLSERVAISVDRDSFDDAMRRISPKVTVRLGDSVEVIEFRSLDDFHPDGLFGTLGVFDELRELRRGLRSREDYERAAGRVRSWFATPQTEAVSVSGDERSGNLLDEILGASAPASNGSPLDDFITGVVAAHRVRIDEDEQRSLIAAVDEAITAVMRSILHDPGFLALESIWRGLWFVVKRFETDRFHQLFILDATQEEFSTDLRDSHDLSESFFARSIGGDSEYGIVGLGYDFALDVDGAAALMRTARVAGAVGTPVVSHLLPGVFGVSEWSGAARVVFDDSSAAGKLWNAVRSCEGASSLGLSVMRVVGRLPYGASFDAIDGFGFEEFADVPDAGCLPWLNPCFSLALVRAIGARDGIAPTEFTRLPLATFKSDDGAGVIPCAEVVMTEAMMGTLVSNGITPIVGFRDDDRVVIAHFQSIAR